MNRVILNTITSVAVVWFILGACRPARAAEFVDFAKLEHEHPLSQAYLESLKPETLDGWDQEAIDQLYARLGSGPIPDGPFDGKVVFAKGTDLDKIFAIAKRLFVPVGFIKKYGPKVWRGKTFLKKKKLLINRTLIGDHYPAKVYCGQSLLDSRRESIIIDYAFNDEITEYFSPRIDKVVNRRGLDIRDEIRMVRPGFYLGRAYMHRVFVLNFILTKKEESANNATAWADECWPGFQRLSQITE